MVHSMYVVKQNGLLELRQVRFRPLFAKGKPDKNDVCITAHSLSEMKQQAEALYPGRVDYSLAGA